MDEKITIEIDCSDTLVNWAVAGGTLVLSVWLALLITYFNIAGLVLFLIVLTVSVGFIILYEKTPTVVTADGEAITYKHLLPAKSIMLSNIKTIACEPYEVHTRYSTVQRVRLCITTKDGDECELNDRINAVELVNGMLESKQTDVPLVTLYQFIKQKTEL